MTTFDYDKIPKLETPIDLVVVHQTESNACYNITDCIEIIKDLHQHDHHGNKFNSQYNDDQFQKNNQSRFNFLIGGDGRVYEGLGFGYRANYHGKK